MTLKLTLALVMAFITAVIVGRFYVPWLKKIKAGQEIKENGPTWHMSKSGTPTMGGVIFISACTLVCLTVGFDSMRSGDFTHIFVLLFALAFGASSSRLSSLSSCCAKWAIYRLIYISRFGTSMSISPR